MKKKCVKRLRGHFLQYCILCFLSIGQIFKKILSKAIYYFKLFPLISGFSGKTRNVFSKLNAKTGLGELSNIINLFSFHVFCTFVRYNKNSAGRFFTNIGRQRKHFRNNFAEWACIVSPPPPNLPICLTTKKSILCASSLNECKLCRGMFQAQLPSLWGCVCFWRFQFFPATHTI